MSVHENPILHGGDSEPEMDERNIASTQEATRSRLDSLQEHLYSKKEHQITVDGQQVRIVDYQPVHLNEQSVPIFVLPGFSETAVLFDECLQHLAMKGRRALCVDAVHGVDVTCADEKYRLGKYPCPQVRKAVPLLKALQELNIQKADIVCHSEGGITAAIAANIDPQRFRNIILMNPAGMIGQDNLLRLLFGFAIDKTQETFREVAKHIQGIHTDTREKIRKVMRGAVEGIKSMAADPIQALKEIFSITETQIHEWIRELQHKGVRVGIIHSEHDQLFPLRSIQQFITAANIPLEHVHTVSGPHNTMYTKPTLSMNIVEKELSLFEKESSRHST